MGRGIDSLPRIELAMAQKYCHAHCVTPPQMTGSPSGEEEMRLVQRDKTLPRLLHTAATEHHTPDVPISTESSLPTVRGGRLTFVASVILVTLAFSIGFSYLLEKRWLHSAVAPARPSPAAGSSAAPSIAEVPEAETVALNPDMFHVTGIAMGDSRLALINGKRLAEGESLVVATSAGAVSVRVAKIDDGIVHLVCGRQKIDARLTGIGTSKIPPP
jgi:hypothetical protein